MAINKRNVKNFIVIFFGGWKAVACLWIFCRALRMDPLERFALFFVGWWLLDTGTIRSSCTRVCDKLLKVCYLYLSLFRSILVFSFIFLSHHDQTQIGTSRNFQVVSPWRSERLTTHVQNAKYQLQWWSKLSGGGDNRPPQRSSNIPLYLESTLRVSIRFRQVLGRFVVKLS